MADKIQNAYETSKNIYDDVLTQRNIFSKLYIKLFWSGTDDNDIARQVLAYVPDDLDVYKRQGFRWIKICNYRNAVRRFRECRCNYVSERYD